MTCNQWSFPGGPACTPLETPRLAPVSVSDELKLLESVENQKSMDPHNLPAKLGPPVQRDPNARRLSKDLLHIGSSPSPHQSLQESFRKQTQVKAKNYGLCSTVSTLHSWHFQAVQVPATDLVSTQEAVRSHSILKQPTIRSLV